MTSNSQTISIAEINLAEVLEELFMVLSEKEKDVVIKRFSLNNRPRQTLESIGKGLSVTRERVRQIEKIALTKLRRTSKNTKLNLLTEITLGLMKNAGGVMLENDIIAGIINQIKSPTEIDHNIIGLSLSVNEEIEENEQINLYHTFWYSKGTKNESIEKVLKLAKAKLAEKGDIIAEMKLARDIQTDLKAQGEDLSESFITSCLKVDKMLKRVGSEYGLMTWRHVNPKSIRDKAYIVLKKAGRSLHFVELANKITEAQFDKKVVTVQAVHNELIRCEKFVLVGRGLYALREWGYSEGTVADIIEKLLEKNGKMTKKEIMEGVLKQRQVKAGTISLNLQKRASFVRVGRATYSLVK
ncbi:MAG: sigma factor-like helix-turn-helix DNA-binding protein [Candidatus Gracilibacteria bacterium]